jgi:hypothetical protein
MLTSTARGLRPPPSKNKMTQMWAKVALAAATLGISESTLGRMRYEGLIVENLHYRKGGLNVTNPVFYDVNAIRSHLDWLAEDACHAKNELQARWANFWLLRKRTNERVAAQEAEELVKEAAEKAKKLVVAEVQQVEQKTEHHNPPAAEPAERLQGEMQMALAVTELACADHLRVFLCDVISAAEKLNDKILETQQRAAA